METERKRPGPILVQDRFPELRTRLLELLRSLSAEDWDRPTAASRWNVRDVATHLLGGDIGMLSRRRDGYTPPGKPIRSYQDLIDLINNLNDTWVRATRRMSGPVICDLLEYTGPQVEAYFASLDPFALGGFRSCACLARSGPRIDRALASSAADSGRYRPPSAVRAAIFRSRARRIRTRPAVFVPRCAGG